MGTSHAQHHVFVIDDYEGTRDGLTVALTSGGFAVTTARSGHEALEILQAGFRPCMILLDVRLGDMDGWTVWERLQEHSELASTAVVILSATEADHDRARAVGIRDFLTKPVEKERLIAALEWHCHR